MVLLNTTELKQFKTHIYLTSKRFAFVNMIEHNSVQTVLEIKLPFGEYIIDLCRKNCIVFRKIWPMD